VRFGGDARVGGQFAHRHWRDLTAVALGGTVRHGVPAPDVELPIIPTISRILGDFMLRRVAALLAVLALVLAACGSNAAPALVDPKEILAKSATSMKDVKTLHLAVALNGKVSADLAGGAGGGSATPFDLSGTTATLDADIAGGKLKASATIPALFGTGGEIIVTDGALYYKISGPAAPTDKYTKITIPTDLLKNLAPTETALPSMNPQVAIDELNKQLAKLPAPTKLADEKCGDTDCYHIQLHVTAQDLAALAPTAASASPDASASAATGDVTIDVWTRKNDLRPAKLVIALNMGAQGNLNTTIDATYDAALTIAAPPADQVVEGTLPFPLPSSAP
jgi:hypothetical protein